MKKMLSLTLVAVLLLAMFAGCASSAPSADAATKADTVTKADTATNADAATKAGEKIKLEFWDWEATDEVIKLFNSNNPDIEVVKVQLSHADVNSRLSIALSAGIGAPDIYKTTSRYFPQFRDMGKMYDMTADMQDVIGGFPEALQKLVQKDGKIYGLPCDISPSVLWYRKDIFDENGIGEIKTFTEYNEAAKKLKAKGIYMMPAFNPAGSWGANAVGMMLGSRDGNYFTADGKVIKNNKDLEIVLTWLDDMVDNQYAESLTFFTPEFWGEFKSGKVASWIMNVSEGSNIKSTAPENSGKWSVTNVPKWDDKDKAMTGFWGGTVMSIPDQSKNKEAAVRFVKTFTTDTKTLVLYAKTCFDLPAYTEALSDPYFKQDDPYFSDENAFEKFNETPSFYYYDWGVTEKIIGEKLDLMFAGKLTPIEAARAMEDTIAKETGR